MFFRGSRYEAVPTTEVTTPAGRLIRYKRIRFIPDTRGVLPYVVAPGDRIDLVAYRTYKDPEQFWRIADANQALRPEELVVRPGRRLLVQISTGF